MANREEAAVSRFRKPLLKHHSRRGLSVPLELRGVDGVQLDHDNVRVNSPRVTSKDYVAGLETIRVELTISCCDLPKLPNTGACMRCFAVLFVYAPHGTRQWKEYGRTETVQHGTSPTFTRSFILELLQKQKLDGAHHVSDATRAKVHVYHKATSKPTLEGQDLLGTHEFSLADLYNVPGRCQKSKLDAISSVTVRLTPIVVNSHSVSIAVSGLGFRREEQFGNIEKASLPDLFFCLLRGNEGEDVTDVETCYRASVRLAHLASPRSVMCTLGSEVVWQADMPRWKPIEMTLHRLCSGELDNTLKLEVYDWSNSGDHTLLGALLTTPRALINKQTALVHGMELAPDNYTGGEGQELTSKPYGYIQMTGDLHENVPVTQPTEGQVDSVYYVDVGDAPQVEDQRFLSRLMADSRVQGTNTREVVDAGMRAVAQREYFMNAFKLNRQALQSMHTATAARFTSGDFGSFLSQGAPESPASPSAKVKPETAAADEELHAQTSLPSLGASAAMPPSMLGRRSKMRHSFAGSGYSNTSMGASVAPGFRGRSSMSSGADMRSRSVSPVRHTNSSLLKVGLSAAQCQRLSPKYQRLPNRLRNVAPRPRDRDGKLFQVLFPRNRYAEMYDIPDDLAEKLSGIRSR